MLELLLLGKAWKQALSPHPQGIFKRFLVSMRKHRSGVVIIATKTRCFS
jgi:hypothetical protein